MRSLLTLAAVCFFTALVAQTANKEMDLAAHQGVSYLGASISKPYFIGKDYKSPDYWRGVHFKSGLFMMKLAWGQQVKSTADSTTRIGKGFILNWGIRFSKPTTQRGRMTIGSCAIRPVFDAGMAFAAITKDSIVKGWGSGAMSFGAHLTPGLIVRASSIYVIGTLNIDAMIGIQERKMNLARGLIITPTVTVGFDNCWELLSPKRRRYTGTMTYTEWVTTGYTYRTERTQEGIYDVTRYYQIERGFMREKTVPYDYVLHKIDPFWGIGPAFTFFPQNDNVGATSMYGGVFGIKVSFLKLEAQYMQGSRGLHNGMSSDAIRYAKHENRLINYTASVQATEVSGKAGINLGNILFGRNHFINYDKRSKFAGSTFYGINVYYKYGKMTFTGAPAYTFAGAELQLDSAFDANNIESSAATDARKLPGSSTFQGFGVSFDMGCVSMSYEKLFFDQAAIADGAQVTVSLIFPVQKAIALASVKHKVKKDAKKKKEGSNDAGGSYDED